jgi:hypothetical protein
VTVAHLASGVVDEGVVRAQRVYSGPESVCTGPEDQACPSLRGRHAGTARCARVLTWLSAPLTRLERQHARGALTCSNMTIRPTSQGRNAVVNTSATSAAPNSNDDSGCG